MANGDRASFIRHSSFHIRHFRMSALPPQRRDQLIELAGDRLHLGLRRRVAHGETERDHAVAVRRGIRRGGGQRGGDGHVQRAEAHFPRQTLDALDALRAIHPVDPVRPIRTARDAEGEPNLAPDTPTLQQLQCGLAISEQIAALEAELASIFSGSAAPAKAVVNVYPATKADGRPRKRSAKTIAKMKASQRARWAKLKGTKVEAPAAKAPLLKKKRTMSPEHRAKLVASAKARWAAKMAG